MPRPSLRRPCRAARRLAPLPLLVALWLPAAAVRAAPTLTAEAEGAALAGGALHLRITLAGVGPEETRTVSVTSEDGRRLALLELDPGEHEVRLPDAALASGWRTVTVRSGPLLAAAQVRVLPGWLSVVPPLIAIGLALVFRDVLVSLFLGVFAGALLLAGGDPLTAFGRSIDHYIVPSITNPDNAPILVFSLLLGAMVGVITKNGGSRGIVERLAPYATNARRGQLAAWWMGLLIFFDDYANTLIVGSTMRPVTDRLRISREKLAYIVDSTAAPVASVVPISTWIGFEVGLIATAFAQTDIPLNAYATFVASIPYRFYPILALVLGFAIAASCRDFGPMLKAELRASHTGQVIRDGDTPLADYQSEALTPVEGTPHRAINALLPVVTVIGVTIAGLFVTGTAELSRADFPDLGGWLRAVFTASDSSRSLLWASLSGVTVAVLLSVVQRILRLTEAMAAVLEGFKSMLLAMVVLVLAWSIGSVCGELHTADYLVALTQGVLAPHWVPVLVFALSAAVAFATGTSWGTMGVLMPLVVPVVHGLSVGAGHPVDSATYHTFLVGTISSVLAGSVWGDHCSPISDTTILSSMASGCDHIAHVRTQLPYALGIGVVGMVLGDIPTAFGLSPWISLVAASAVIVGGVYWLGRRSDAEAVLGSGEGSAAAPTRA